MLPTEKPAADGRGLVLIHSDSETESGFVLNSITIQEGNNLFT